MKKQVPEFQVSDELCRYVEPGYRHPNRIQTGAFKLRPDEASLSVNSLEVDDLGAVAEIFAHNIERGPRPVAVAIRTVDDFNQAAVNAGVAVTFDNSANAFVFNKSGSLLPAYKFTPKKKQVDPPKLENGSHCDVDLVSGMDAYQEHRFAVRMAFRPYYKMV